MFRNNLFTQTLWVFVVKNIYGGQGNYYSMGMNLNTENYP